MGKPGDQQQSDATAQSKATGNPKPVDPRPAFQETVLRSSPAEVKRSIAQGRVRPNPVPNPQRISKIQSRVEELPKKKSPQDKKEVIPQRRPRPTPPQVALSIEYPKAPSAKTTSQKQLVSPQPTQAATPTPASAQPSATPKKETAYTDKTERIFAWSNLLRSLQPFIWGAILLVVVVPLIGKALLFYSSTTPAQRPMQPLTEIVVPSIPRGANVDKALVEAVEVAHQSAHTFAKAELNDWKKQLDDRVDHFLDWYFGYFNQKKMEFMTPLVWGSSAAIHKINPNHMKANEAVMARFTEEFQKQFAKQVLVPQTAQIKLENITTETVNRYLLALRNNMDEMQVKYRIPQGQWDRYLADISTTIQDTEGNLSNISLKMLVGGSGYMLAKPLVLSTAGKLGAKVSSKFAGTAAAKLAAKTGGTVAAELGTSLVDPIVGVGIFIWDIWDYQHTVKLERPLLKENLMDYLQGMEQSLLNDPEVGVFSAIAQLEQGIFQSL